MTFFFSLLDIVLSTVLLVDTLGLAYQLRQKGTSDQKDYIRVCFTWIIFLSLSGILSCNRVGFFGTLLRIVFFVVKAYLVLPILGGSAKLYKYLIEDGNAEKYYQKVSQLAKAKLGKYCPCQCQTVPDSTCATSTPETPQ